MKMTESASRDVVVVAVMWCQWYQRQTYLVLSLWPTMSQ